MTGAFLFFLVRDARLQLSLHHIHIAIKIEYHDPHRNKEYHELTMPLEVPEIPPAMDQFGVIASTLGLLAPLSRLVYALQAQASVGLDLNVCWTQTNFYTIF